MPRAPFVTKKGGLPSERSKRMDKRGKFVTGIFLLVAFAIVGTGSGLTADRTVPGGVQQGQERTGSGSTNEKSRPGAVQTEPGGKRVPGAVQSEEGGTINVPLACTRESGTCSCNSGKDC